MPAAERVWPERCGKLRGAGLVERDMHWHCREASCFVMQPGRHHAHVAEDRRAGGERRAPGRAGAVGEGEVADDVRHAAGVDDARCDRRDVRRAATPAPSPRR